MTVGETILSVACLTGSDQNKTYEKRTKRACFVWCVRVCVFVLLLDRERSRVFASTSRDLVLVAILSHVYDQLQLKFLLTVIV